MNNEFLNCLLSDKEELKKCLKWLSSQKDEVGDHGFRKTDFVIFFLTYLRLQTASLFKQKQGERKPDWKIATPVTDTQTLVVKPLSTGDTVRRLFSPEHENLPPNGVLLSPVKHRPNITDERQYGNFQNSRTPQKLFNPQSGNWELVNAIHHNPTWSQSNNFQMNQQNNPFSPPNHYQGGQRNYTQGVGQAAYHTPRRTNYRNSLVFSNSSSSSGILSPESPKMPGDFRKFGGGDRRGPTPKNPCIGDFIVGATRKQERGGRKRIKPTRLPTSSDSQISDTSNVSNPINDLFTRVPESSSASSNLSDRATNYDEERKLLKQYNSEKEGNSNLQNTKMTKKVNDSPNKKQQERKKKGVDIKSPAIKVKPKEDVCSESRTETENLRATSTGKKENVAMTSPEPIFIRPDPSKVIKPLVLEDLAEIYCVLLDYNLLFNVTTEIHFVISLLAVNVAVKESDKHPNSDKSDENSPKKEQSVNVVCEENILGVDKLESSASPPSPTPTSSPPSFSPTSHPPTSPPLTSLPITANELNKDVKDLLNDVHSSVYFACVVLEKQIKFFQLLDRSTLKLLSENWKIELFAPRLRGKLVELYSLQRSTAPKPSASTPKGPELGICPVQFHAESDNRSTFSSDNSFATFRKQRDELYNILQAWNKSQQQQVDGGSGESGVTFTKVKGRVDRLLAMSQDPINVRHLAKHFCDLLLKAVSTCEENTIEELENLPDVNKSKLTLLTKRLTEPSSEKIASPRPETSFPGFQQFYHDFLVMASQNFLFNVHLINCFVKEITARSSATYDIDESDGEGQVVQEETRQMFVHGLSSLCVLAKFLGLVVFAPYRSSSEISKSVLQEEINIRKQLEPPLKLETHLNEAVKRGSLVYTVPWIVEYLGMMDTVAPHLPHYQNVLVTLFNVYLLCVPKWSLELPQSASKEEKSTTKDETGETFVSNGEKLLSNNEELVSKEEELVSKEEKLVSKGEIVENLVPNIDKLVSKDGKLVSNDKKLMSSDEKLVSKVVIDGNLVTNDENCRKVIKLAPFVCSLLRLCLGWLFDSENFPQEVMVKVALHSDVEQFLEEKFQTTRNKLTMDNSSDLVTREMIHKFCPYLKSFHGLLARKDTANGVVTVRHVTPISKGGSSLTPPAASCSLVPPEIALQLQLEDHFFMGQSESVQRTVEFVAERIASACIKEVIGTVVVGLKRKVTDIMELESTEPKKVDIQPLVSEYKTSVMKQLAIVKEERLGVALKALLGPDISSQSLDLCQQITARKFQERVINWLQTHINIEEILSKMLTNYENEHKNSNNNNDDDDALEDFFKVEKFDQNRTDAVDSASKTFSVDEITVCSKTLIHIQDISSDALESFGKQGMKTADEALELVSTVERGLKKCPSNPIKKQICTALLDYVILMISFRPEQVTDAVIGQLASVVSEISEVMHLWSQRNVMLLFQGQPSTYAAVWKRFSRLTYALVEKNAMDICSLEQQVVSLFRCSWPDNVLQTISEGIQCTVTDLKMNSLCDAEFLDLLSNIAVDIKADEYD